MNMMDKGIDFMTRKREQTISEPVKYKSGSNILNLMAARGSTLFRYADRDGITTYSRSADFILPNPGFIPKRGDRIFVDSFCYEVLAPNNEQVYRFSDHAGNTIRIHAKLIGSVDEK